MDAEESGIPPATPSNPLLPHYPELIFAAIEALDSKNGANKSKISKQIEASYGSLPAAHKTLLSHHLNKMRASGQLVVIKNNYVKPDPNSPPPRGRGRPPKPKVPVPEGTVISPARPRGRPRKSQDLLNPASSEVVPSVSGRKRGRPPKLDKATATAPAPVSVLTTDEYTSGALSPKVQTPATGEKKGRGRPPKVKTGNAPAAAPAAATASGERRGRGRPPKVKAVAPVEA